MGNILGNLCIVLHSHVPHVLHHGDYPHGESWLYEAAAESYLPLLEMIDEVAMSRGHPTLTIGLTPVLLEQLSHPDFERGFVAYLNERREHARYDRREFERTNETHFAMLATRWEKWYEHALETFARIGQDIPGEFAIRQRQGDIGILTGPATHPYMPLLLHDQMIHAQLACGKAVTHQRLGIQPRGMWLPECAYRPTVEHWLPPAIHGDTRNRPGLEFAIAAAGLDHFFVHTRLITEAAPVAVVREGQFSAVADAQRFWDRARGWGRVLDPVGVVSSVTPPDVWAFARHPNVAEQVWSGTLGYPGCGEYLDFHRQHGDCGQRGLRYHKVTHNQSPLNGKAPYRPDEVAGRLFENSEHFCRVVRDVLQQYHAQTGRVGTVVAPFDAELFGHWWFEGIGFLRNVMLNFSGAGDVILTTSENALAINPRDKVVRMPEGSWGEKGNHSVWMEDRNRWMWEVEYRAEDSLLGALASLPWKTDARVRQMLEHAARQLLLLQASDWPFTVHGKAALDYGIQRFAGHSTSFSRVLAMAHTAARGMPFSDLQKAELLDIELHDSIFREIDLNWWTDK